jgi:hypothetical protein
MFEFSSREDFTWFWEQPEAVDGQTGFCCCTFGP